jgi:hypothetical protein
VNLRIRLGLASVVVSTACAAAAVATSADATKHPRAHRSAAAVAVAGYAALARPATAVDRDRWAVAGAATEDPTLRVDAARVLRDDAGGRTWLIPTTDGKLCLAEQPAPGEYEALEQARHLGHLRLGYACRDQAAAASAGIAIRTYDDVIAVVPDGATAVTTAAPDAPSRAPELVGGVLRVDASSPAPGSGTESFRDEDGHQISLTLP